MKELRFVNWQDFQDFCCYWMTYLVQKNLRLDVKYKVYGGDGQGQHGIDLIPAQQSIGIVGQSKNWDVKTYTWNDVLKDLEKAKNYPGPIKIYVILTSARPHKSIQNKLNSGTPYYHDCPNKGRFQVVIHYWDEIENLDFVPRHALERYFPKTYQLTSKPENTATFNDLQNSLTFAREFLPTLITPAHINWLEKWEFKQGFVPKDQFDIFHDIHIDMDRINHARQTPGLRAWLSEGNRLKLSQCLPAAEELFNAISEFVKTITSYTIGKTLPDGKSILTLDHSPMNYKITNTWKYEANNVLRLYRELVQGIPQS